MQPRSLQWDSRGIGEALVLVPGALTGWLSWAPHQERLATRWRTVRVQPIHNELGSSGKQADAAYSVETERESLRLTLDTLGIERTHLAGWSGGGRALIEFALGYPECVRSLTLVEPAAYWILERTGERDPALDEINSVIRGISGREVSEDDLTRFLRIAGFVGPLDDVLLHPSWERWKPHRAALSWQWPLGESSRTLDDLSRIVAPTLLFKGTVTTAWLKRVVDELGTRLPRATVVELVGDHACHLQDMDRFLAAMQAHLSAASLPG